MSEQEKLNLIINNLFESITTLTEAKELLEKNEKTKQYLEKYNDFEEQYHKNLTCEESNDHFEMVVNYEQAISVSAFLVGFQKGVQFMKAVDNKDFVSNMLEMLM